MKDRSKPCPFCGGKSTISKFENFGAWYHVHCSKCHISQIGVSYKTRESAIEAWNRRAEPQTTVIHAKNLAGISLFRCSNCCWSCSDTYYGDTPTYNFCPNCGAKMDTGGET